MGIRATFSSPSALFPQIRPHNRVDHKAEDAAAAEAPHPGDAADHAREDPHHDAAALDDRRHGGRRRRRHEGHFNVEGEGRREGREEASSGRRRR